MICPVCKTSNSEEAASCGSCGLHLDARTLAFTQERPNEANRPLQGSGSAANATAPAPARSGTAALAPGRLLGARYRIEVEAGHGGMGRVYRATDVELNRTVALKVIRDELANDSTTIARLKEEIRLASEISHPNVLRIHDLGEAEGIQFISMAWVEGEDLEHLIRRSGRLPEQDIIRIAEQLCEALEAAHNKRIIHRDLKPQNILIDAGGNAYISDFGLAQSLASDGSAHLTQTGYVVGTPRYMSPEQLQGQAVDGRTDVYALGLVLYEMATGATPDIQQRVFQNPPSPRIANSAISQKLERIILLCLEVDPAKRYATAGEILEDLHRGKPANRIYALRPYRKWVYGGAAAVLLAALGATFAIRRGPATLTRAPAAGEYVAVLPFSAVGTDPKLKIYSEGIMEAVSGRLFALQRVHPISEAAIERADLRQPIEGIARQVGANFVVSGTIEDQGGTLVVRSSVKNVETHESLAQDTFSGGAGSLLAIENSVYEQAARALGAQPSGENALAQAARPNPDPEAYDLYLKGRELLKNRRDAAGTTAALDLFQRATTKDPGFALAWTGVADASLQMYRLNSRSFWAAKALDAARRAASDTGNLPEVHFTLGSVYTATGKNAQAVEELKRALELEPNSDNGYLRLGRAYLATGNTDAAFNALRKAVDLNPYYWYNHDQLGLAFFRIGRNEDALKEFKRALDLDPNNADLYNSIGGTYYRMSRWQDCVEEFKKVINLQPSAEAYTNLGTAYFALGRYREAIADFKKAVQINNTDVLYVMNLGDAYRQAGQKAQANKTYGDAIGLAYQQLQVNPQDATTMGCLAMCYAKEGESDKAMEFIQRARGIDAADNQLIYDEAVIDAVAGRTEEALKLLEKALASGYSLEEARIDPDLKALRSNPAFPELLKKFENQVARR